MYRDYLRLNATLLISTRSVQSLTLYSRLKAAIVKVINYRVKL